MVTLAWATERATPARKPVRPSLAPLDHAVNDGLDELDGAHHVVDKASKLVLPVDFTEIAIGRSAIIVDENVDLADGA